MAGTIPAASHDRRMMTPFSLRIVAVLLVLCLIGGPVGAGFHPHPSLETEMESNEISGRRGSLPLQFPFASQALADRSVASSYSPGGMEDTSVHRHILKAGTQQLRAFVTNPLLVGLWAAAVVSGRHPEWLHTVASSFGVDERLLRMVFPDPRGPYGILEYLALGGALFATKSTGWIPGAAMAGSSRIYEPADLSVGPDAYLPRYLRHPALYILKPSLLGGALFVSMRALIYVHPPLAVHILSSHLPHLVTLYYWNIFLGPAVMSIVSAMAFWSFSRCLKLLSEFSSEKYPQLAFLPYVFVSLLLACGIAFHLGCTDLTFMGISHFSARAVIAVTTVGLAGAGALFHRPWHKIGPVWGRRSLAVPLMLGLLFWWGRLLVPSIQYRQPGSGQQSPSGVFSPNAHLPVSPSRLSAAA